MSDSLFQYFRYPAATPMHFGSAGPLSQDAGFFSLGGRTVCYGRTSTGYRSQRSDEPLYDVLSCVKSNGSVQLPFNLGEVCKNLTYEKYIAGISNSDRTLGNRIVREAYYAVRPALPVGLRSQIQKLYLGDWRKLSFPKWPVDFTFQLLMKQVLKLGLAAAGLKSIPFIWFWPNRASAASIMTHDVEAETGRSFCSTLMQIDEAFRIPASFQVVPERRYRVTECFLQEIKDRGFEVAVQDLNHDGRLFWNIREFEDRVEKINRYGKDFGAVGFRSAVLYRNQAWFDRLRFEYDMSVPNVAHLDPQRGGCCTVMPHFIGDIVELPVTTTQDHSLFNVLNTYSLDLWKRQINSIMANNGLLSFIVHPDYTIEKRARETYKRLLVELEILRRDRDVWIAKPREVNRWWRARAKMELVKKNGHLTIEGPEAERASIATAWIENDDIVFEH